MGFIIGLLTLFPGSGLRSPGIIVLIQLPKKDAGAGLAFGGAASDALFGAGSGNVLTKVTECCRDDLFCDGVAAVHHANPALWPDHHQLLPAKARTATGGSWRRRNTGSCNKKHGSWRSPERPARLRQQFADNNSAGRVDECSGCSHHQPGSAKIGFHELWNERSPTARGERFVLRPLDRGETFIQSVQAIALPLCGIWYFGIYRLPP